MSSNKECIHVLAIHFLKNKKRRIRCIECKADVFVFGIGTYFARK
jgi:hypothetical protein